LEASGYQVLHIMNLTDVDDRTIAAARDRGVSLREHVDPFVKAFREDRDWLRILPAHEEPRATEYIPAMIRLIQGLLEKGIAYRGDDGSVYFSIAKFPAYGRLSRLDLRELKTGASERVTADEYAKEDARDFVLWKAAKPEDEAVGAAWDAAFGRGRPGWHIECSAMALELIRQRFGTDVLDIHAGGVDLIFPHHEDEIAQSCAYTGRDEFARFWLHGEFLDIEGTKMSKRYGNVLTPRDLREDGIPAEAIRLLMFGTHYRKKLDWSDDALAGAREGSHRLGQFQRRLLKGKSGEDSARLLQAAERLNRDLAEALNDDLNAPRAVAALFVFMNDANAALDAGERPGMTTLSAWEKAEGVLRVTSQVHSMVIDARAGSGAIASDGATPLVIPPVTPPSDLVAAEEWARRWATARAQYKSARNYAEADRIRALLQTHGFEVRDSRDGTIEVVRTTARKA
jgi:cysteinyl-tRNA synthetase